MNKFRIIVIITVLVALAALWFIAHASTERDRQQAAIAFEKERYATKLAQLTKDVELLESIKKEALSLESALLLKVKNQLQHERDPERREAFDRMLSDSQGRQRALLGKADPEEGGTADE